MVGLQRSFGAEYGYASRWGALAGAVIRLLGVADLPTRLRARLILPWLAQLKPANALDIGFGCGHWSFWLARNSFARKIVAVDPDDYRVVDANAIANKLQVTSINFRAGHVPEAIADLATGAWDLALAIEVIHLVSPIENLLARFHELLRPGGWLVAHVPCLPANREHEKYQLDEPELRRLCEQAGFRVRHLARTFGPWHRRLFVWFGKTANVSKPLAVLLLPALLVLSRFSSIEHPDGDHRFIIAERLET